MIGPFIHGILRILRVLGKDSPSIDLYHLIINVLRQDRGCWSFLERSCRILWVGGGGIQCRWGGTPAHLKNLVQVGDLKFKEKQEFRIFKHFPTRSAATIFFQKRSCDFLVRKVSAAETSDSHDPLPNGSTDLELDQIVFAHFAGDLLPWREKFGNIFFLGKHTWENMASKMWFALKNQGPKNTWRKTSNYFIFVFWLWGGTTSLLLDGGRF